MGENIKLVSSLVDKFLAGDSEGYLDGCRFMSFMERFLVD